MQRENPRERCNKRNVYSRVINVTQVKRNDKRVNNIKRSVLKKKEKTREDNEWPNATIDDRSWWTTFDPPAVAFPKAIKSDAAAACELFQLFG